MDVGVTSGDNLQGQPFFKLVERLGSVLLRVVVSAAADIAGPGSRQKLHGAHHRSNQPFDMATEVGTGDRTILELHIVFRSAPLERLAIKPAAIMGHDDKRREESERDMLGDLSRHSVDRVVTSMRLRMDYPADRQ